MVCKCSLVERLDLLPMAVLLMIGGNVPASRAKPAHPSVHLPRAHGRRIRSDVSVLTLLSKTFYGASEPPYCFEP
jgi:hypothetical protein